MPEEVRGAPEPGKEQGMYWEREGGHPTKRRMGPEDLPIPKGEGYIQTRWDLCIGCGVCEMVCSHGHFRVMNRDYSRIRIYRYLLPVPKSVQNVCAHCPPRERECEKACPLKPSAIHYDEKNFHMTVDSQRCATSGCHKECMTGCPAQVPHPSPDGKSVIVCDLCEENGVRQPRCVAVCPFYALEFLKPQFPSHLDRIHPDEKAEALSRRFYPLKRNQIQLQPDEVWKER